MFLKKMAVIFLCASLMGCASDTKKEESPEQMYARAQTLFTEGEYTESAKLFDDIEQQYPYSEWASRAQIMAAYTFYYKNDYDEALLALDRFIQLHPGNRNTPYAYYLKGLCYYEQMSDTGREQQMAANAMDTFQRLVSYFPESIYRADADVKIAQIRNHLAAKEMAVGRYYLKRGDYMPALNRFQNVISQYGDTEQLAEALYRTGVCFTALGMKRQAQKTAAHLDKEFPGNKWQEKMASLNKRKN